MHEDETEWLNEQRAKFHAESQKFWRQQARRRKIALFCLIPYTAFPLLVGSAIGRVMDAGLNVVAAMLIVGFGGIMLMQWIQPEILRRKEDR